MAIMGADPATVISLNNWTLDYSVNMIDVTSFGDVVKAVVPDLPDVKGTFGGFWDDTEDAPFEMAMASAGGYFYGYPDGTNAPTKYAYGPAYFTASIDVPVSGAVTIKGTFSASGAWYNGL
jgi:hypothetical protein